MKVYVRESEKLTVNDGREGVGLVLRLLRVPLRGLRETVPVHEREGLVVELQVRDVESVNVRVTETDRVGLRVPGDGVRDRGGVGLGLAERLGVLLRRDRLCRMVRVPVADGEGDVVGERLLGLNVISEAVGDLVALGLLLGLELRLVTDCEVVADMDGVREVTVRVNVAVGVAEGRVTLSVALHVAVHEALGLRVCVYELDDERVGVCERGRESLAVGVALILLGLTVSAVGVTVREKLIVMLRVADTETVALPESETEGVAVSDGERDKERSHVRVCVDVRLRVALCDQLRRGLGLRVGDVDGAEAVAEGVVPVGVAVDVDDHVRVPLELGLGL